MITSSIISDLTGVYHTRLKLPTPGSDKWLFSKMHYTSAYEIAVDITEK